MGIKLIEVKRREHGLTKAALAKATGITPTMMGWIESGRYTPYRIQLERLADALEVDDPDTLLEEVGR